MAIATKPIFVGNNKMDSPVNASWQVCAKCNDKVTEEAEVRALLEYLYLDVKVRSPDEVSKNPFNFSTIQIPNLLLNTILFGWNAV